MTYLILISIILWVCFGHAVWRYHHKKHDNSKLPPPPQFPGAWPIIGHAHMFLGDTTRLWKLIKELGYQSLKNGGIGTLFVGNWTLAVITDPEDCYLVSKTCLHKDSSYDMAKPWLGEGLVTASEASWRRSHKLLTPAFSQQVLDGFLDTFNSQARRLVETLATMAKSGCYFNPKEYLDETTLDVTYCTVMGIDNTKENFYNKQFKKYVPKMQNNIAHRMQTLWMHSEFLYKWATHKKRRDELIEILHTLSNTIVQKRKSTLNQRKPVTNNASKFKSVLEILLDSSLDGSFTDEAIREHVDTMITAGYDSSSTHMTFTLLLLGSYPDVQDRVYEELRRVLGDSDRDIDKQDLSNFVYLEAVIKESLRVYPVAPLVGRYLQKDIELKSSSLSAGTTCLLFFYGMHRHSSWGADAEEFRPERWLDGSLPDNPNAFGGFSIGRRICLGQKFAMMSVKTIIAHILLRYKVSGDHTKLQLKLDLTLKPVSGHHISLAPRTSRTKCTIKQ